MSSGPFSKDLILRNTLVAIVAYGIGVSVALGLGNRPGDSVAFYAGLASFLVGYVVLHRLLLRRFPPLGRRPWRYSPPNGIGLLSCMMISSTAAANGWLDAAGTYAVAMPVFIAGGALSDLWWSLAAPSDVPRATGVDS